LKPDANKAHPDDLKRILEMDLTVNVSPNFSTDWSGQKAITLSLLGPERVASQLSMYPRVFDNGNKVSLSADIPSSPIEQIGPLFQMQPAMTLRDPSNPDSVVFPDGRKGITLKRDRQPGLASAHGGQDRQHRSRKICRLGGAGCQPVRPRTDRHRRSAGAVVDIFGR